MGSSLPLISAVTAGLLVLASCKDDPTEPAPHRWTEPKKAKPDQVDPQELAVGKENAFGLALPRGLNVHSRTNDQVIATGRLPRDRVANFLRQRLEPRASDTGPTRTTFRGARIRGKSGARRYRVVVEEVRKQTVVRVIDETPVPDTMPSATEEERWKAVGLTPDGKLPDGAQLD